MKKYPIIRTQEQLQETLGEDSLRSYRENKKIIRSRKRYPFRDTSKNSVKKERTVADGRGIV
jgi:hypothetical protein